MTHFGGPKRRRDTDNRDPMTSRLVTIAVVVIVAAGLLLVLSGKATSQEFPPEKEWTYREGTHPIDGSHQEIAVIFTRNGRIGFSVHCLNGAAAPVIGVGDPTFIAGLIGSGTWRHVSLRIGDQFAQKRMKWTYVHDSRMPVLMSGKKALRRRIVQDLLTADGTMAVQAFNEYGSVLFTRTFPLDGADEVISKLSCVNHNGLTG